MPETPIHSDCTLPYSPESVQPSLLEAVQELRNTQSQPFLTKLLACPRLPVPAFSRASPRPSVSDRRLVQTPRAELWWRFDRTPSPPFPVREPFSVIPLARLVGSRVGAARGGRCPAWPQQQQRLQAARELCAVVAGDLDRGLGRERLFSYPGAPPARTPDGAPAHLAALSRS